MSINLPPYSCRGVTYIGREAFWANHNLTEIVFPEGISTIQYCSFARCELLSEIIIPNNVTTIEDYAFHNGEKPTTNLKSIIIGNGVVQISPIAFARNFDLESITIYATNPPVLGYNNGEHSSAGNYPLYEISECPIYVPAGSVETYKAADGWKEMADRIYAITMNTGGGTTD
ncbi:MAG: leucine-rich repeat domain-containing protein [Bacteroidaceae bacterium]|nr:leucine-rich repeat domain-containing protein [Bacteroidaceae bacterium]